MNRIILRGLRVVATHGLLPAERDRPQPFEVDVTIDADVDRAASTDDLADTIDYSQVVATVERAMTDESCALLETLAARIAASVLALDSRAARVEVTVWKLRPPVPVDMDRAGVTAVRERS